MGLHSGRRRRLAPPSLRKTARKVHATGIADRRPVSPQQLEFRRYQPDSWDATSGSTVVPSSRTASSPVGSRPNALTIVGATCVVVVVAETVAALKRGFATSITTLASSCANPPWSPIMVVLLE